MWGPILEGDLREAALSTLQELSAQVPSESTPDEGNLFLGGGAVGRALFHGYVALAEGSASRHLATRRLLRHILDAWPASSLPWRIQLYRDFLGLAWVSVHLDPGGVDAGPWEEFDELLPSLVAMLPKESGFDLVSGHVGLGTYALERLPGAGAEECLARIVAELDASARREGRGLAWPRTAPEGSWQRQVCTGEYVDLGVAHGVAGIIAFLAEVRAAGIETRQTSALLDPAVAWLLDQRIDGGEGPCFPALAAPGIDRAPSRLAWCYGDAGIAGALLHAARCTGEASWEREAIDIARGSLGWSPERSRVVDATLCHGAAGLAHIYNRFFQSTRLEEFHGAAVAWYARTLGLRRPGQGVGGFLARGEAEGRMDWVAEPGFLIGAAGIGLGLLAAVSPGEPAWDRLLLLSGPSGQGPSRNNLSNSRLQREGREGPEGADRM